MADFGEQLEKTEDPWEVLDGENGLLKHAARAYREKLPTDSDFDVELVYDGLDDWHLYELNSSNMPEPIVLKIKPYDNRGFGVSVENGETSLKYRNFMRYGVCESM